MVFQWVLNGVSMVLNENGKINGLEMLLTLYSISGVNSSNGKKWSENKW